MCSQTHLKGRLISRQRECKPRPTRNPDGDIGPRRKNRDVEIRDGQLTDHAGETLQLHVRTAAAYTAAEGQTICTDEHDSGHVNANADRKLTDQPRWFRLRESRGLMARERILVTGATGKVGKRLVKALSMEGHDVVALCRRGADGMAGENITVLLADICRTADYEMSLKNIDTVVHAAAVTHTNKVERYYEVNTHATAALIEACKKFCVKRFVFISTRAISEDGGCYSKSKSIAERHVSESGLDWVVLRLGEVYGMFGNAGVDGLLKTIGTLPFVPIIGSGEYALSPVYVDDAVAAIVSAVEKQHLKQKIYTIAGPESFSFNQLVDCILRVKGISRPRVHIPLPVVRFLSVLSSLIGGDGFLVKDQLPRLICRKDSDITQAVHDLGVMPRRFEDAIAVNR